MTRQLRSTSTASNGNLIAFERRATEDNLQWGTRAVANMRTGGPKDWSYLVLLGGVDTLSFRLRVAQSHLRYDMLPSYWSESLVVELKGNDIGEANALQVPLHQPEGGVFPTRTNGVLQRPLKDFADTSRWPNIAVIAMPVSQATLLEKIDSFRYARGTVDALEHVLRWLAFAWGSGRTPNPLNDGIGLPSTCMIETACAAAGLDLTPGLESRASCPEAIWTAAKHWQHYFESFNQRQPIGRFHTPHGYPIGDDASPKAPTVPKRKKSTP